MYAVFFIATREPEAPRFNPDLQRRGFKLRAECQFGRVRVIEPGDLVVALGRRKNSSIQLALHIPRLKCFECGGLVQYWRPVTTT